MIKAILILAGISFAILVGCTQDYTDIDEADDFANDCGFVNYQEYLNHRDSVDRNK